MKDLTYLDDYRIDLFGDGFLGDEHNGAFIIPSHTQKHKYFIIASDGEEWEHVSVHLLYNNGEMLERIPRWQEMCEVKELFFEDTEAVMQLHPQKSDYVNEHPYCLHLWRPITKELPLPPTHLVGRQKKYPN